MIETANGLFDEEPDDLSKVDLNKQIKNLLHGKEIDRKEVRKGNMTIIEETFKDNNLNYYSKIVLTTKEKVTTADSKNDVLNELNVKLNKAVEQENYEYAANLRDKIRELKTMF